MSRLFLKKVVDVPTPGRIFLLVDRFDNLMTGLIDIRAHTLKDPIISRVVQTV